MFRALRSSLFSGSVLNLRKKHIIATGLVATTGGLLWYNRKTVKSGTVAFKYTKIYSPKYNPLEKSAYTGDKDQYAKQLKDIQEFNAHRETNKLLSMLLSPLLVPNLFSLANMQQNLEKEEMQLTLKAEATDLLDVFFTTVYKDKNSTDQVNKCLNNMLEYELIINFNPKMWSYLTNKNIINSDKIKKMFSNNSNVTYEQFVSACNKNFMLWNNVKKHLDPEEICNVLNTAIIMKKDKLKDLLTDKLIGDIVNSIKSADNYAVYVDKFAKQLKEDYGITNDAVKTILNKKKDALSQWYRDIIA